MLTTTLLVCSALAVDAPAVQPASSPISPATTLNYRYDPGVEPIVNLALLPDEPQQPEQAPPPHRRIEPYAIKGTTRWNIHGAGAVDFDDGDNTIALFGLGLSHFIADDLSLDLELNVLFINQLIENTEGFNANVLFRWHFIHERRWTMFLDAGAGVLLSVNDVPAHGSSFNFTPQVGAGVTVDLGGDVRLIAGARWLHISNANLYDENPGRDSVMGYAGISFPF